MGEILNIFRVHLKVKLGYMKHPCQPLCTHAQRLPDSHEFPSCCRIRPSMPEPTRFQRVSGALGTAGGKGSDGYSEKEAGKPSIFRTETGRLQAMLLILIVNIWNIFQILSDVSQIFLNICYEYTYHIENGIFLCSSFYILKFHICGI